MTHRFDPPYWIIACIITSIIYFFCLFLLAFKYDQRNKITEDVLPVVIDMSEAVEITSEEFLLHSAD